jgi:hypothetical protein
MCHGPIKLEDSSGRPKFNNVAESDNGFHDGMMLHIGIAHVLKKETAMGRFMGPV